MQEPKTTPLHDWHVAQGANMAVFGGYHMPLWYPSGAKQEHLVVLNHAGLFDTGHMAGVKVAGADAFHLLQWCFTKDLSSCVGKNKSPLHPGKCVYGAFLNERGETIDDAIVFQLEVNSYLVVVNAGMGGTIARHLSSQQGNRDVVVQDLTDKVGKMDIQGPQAARILEKLLAEPEKVFEKIVYFSFKGHFDPHSPLADAVRFTDGTPILLSRTGYTGEFGFEIFVEPAQGPQIWQQILNAGQEFGLLPCGLAARDSLRAGAMLPLSHQDIGAWPFSHHPWPFALPYTDDQSAFTKEFIGAKALRQIQHPEYTYAFVGHDLRKVSTEDPALVLDGAGNAIGRALTCATDMGIGRHEGRIYSVASPDQPEHFNPRGLSCGFVKVKTRLAPGDTVTLKDRRRAIAVIIVDNVRPDRTARRPMREML